MTKRYRCLVCNSTVTVEFDGDRSIKREFFDEYSIKKASSSTYLWGGSKHSCPLLSTTVESAFDTLIQEGKAEEIV